jgi:hypothetical protein
LHAMGVLPRRLGCDTKIDGRKRLKTPVPTRRRETRTVALVLRVKARAARCYIVEYVTKLQACRHKAVVQLNADKGRGDCRRWLPHKYDAETFHTQPPGELVYPIDTNGLALASRYVTNDLHMQEEWLLTTKEGV